MKKIEWDINNTKAEIQWDCELNNGALEMHALVIDSFVDQFKGAVQRFSGNTHSEWTDEKPKLATPEQFEENLAKIKKLKEQAEAVSNTIFDPNSALMNLTNVKR